MSNRADKPQFETQLLVILLSAGSMANYIDRSLLSMMIPQVRRDLSLSNADYALAVHAFLVMYAVFYILGGRIADRLGYRRTFTLAVVFWSLASMANGFVRGLRTLILCQALLGMGEGCYYPTAMRGAAERFPSARRAQAVGMILSAISVGLLVTPPLVASVTLRYGWRAAFLFLGALSLLVLPPWGWLHWRMDHADAPTHVIPSETSEAAASIPGRGDVKLTAVLRTRKYWCVLMARGCSDAAWYFYMFWIPGYFQEIRGLDLGSVGRLLWIPYFCSAVGAIAGAAASSRLIARGLGLHRSRKIVLLGSAAVCIFSASAGFVSTKHLALALVSLALLGHQSWSSNIHTVITEISPRQHVAALYGMTGAAGTLIGAATQLVIGPIVDSYGYKPAFVWVGGMYVLAAILLNCAGTLQSICQNLGGVDRSSSLRPSSARARFTSGGRF